MKEKKYKEVHLYGRGKCVLKKDKQWYNQNADVLILDYDLSHFFFFFFTNFAKICLLLIYYLPMHCWRKKAKKKKKKQKNRIKRLRVEKKKMKKIKTPVKIVSNKRHFFFLLGTCFLFFACIFSLYLIILRV